MIWTILKRTGLGALLSVLIPSIAVAGSMQQIPRAVGNPNPLTQLEVIDFLKKQTPQAVAQIAHERRIDFSISAESERAIRNAGGDGDLIRILRELSLSGSGILYVASEPAGADVTLDGE